MIYFIDFLRILGIFLAISLLVKIVIAFLSKKRGQQILFVILADLFTTPAVLFATGNINFGLNNGYIISLAVAETLAVIAQWQIFKNSHAGFRRPFLFSLLLNLAFLAVFTILFIIMG